MSALVGEKEVCRNHLAGRCTLGNFPKGKSHSPPTAPPRTKTPYLKCVTFKKSDEKYPPPAKIPFRLTVSHEHRAAVSPPRGRQTEKNPLGWSNVLLHTLETAPQDAWASYFTLQDGTEHRAHINMIRTSSISSAITTTGGTI